MIQRSYLEVIKKRLSEPVKQIQVLAGPRQVGKTTLVRQVLDLSKMPHKYISADAIATSNQEWINAVWNDARIALKNM